MVQLTADNNAMSGYQPCCEAAMLDSFMKAWCLLLQWMDTVQGFWLFASHQQPGWHHLLDLWPGIVGDLH